MLGQSVAWGRVTVGWPGWISITKTLRQGWPFDGPAAAIHPPFTLKSNNRKGEGRKMGEMGLCTRAGGMWMKSKGIPKYQRGEVLYSGLCPCSLIRTSPSMLWVSILNTKHLSTLLTGTLISTSQHFSTFTTRLVANQSVWSVSSSQLYRFLFFYFLHIDFFVFYANLIYEAFVALLYMWWYCLMLDLG